MLKKMKHLGLVVSLLVALASLTACKEETVSFNPALEIAEVLPRFNLQTQLDPQDLIHLQVKTKDDYTLARLTLDGRGYFADAKALKVKIRSRGYSTFEQPKKPYKIKLGKAQALLGLPKGKNWMLLANFQDAPLMSNMLAMRLGQAFDLPFTPLLVPIELTVNNEYLGVYWLTPNKEVDGNRIKLAKSGWLLELSQSKTVSDDPLEKNHYSFNSKKLNLPVFVHYPELHELAEKNPKRAIARLNNLANKLDATQVDNTSLAKFLLVQQLAYNPSISHLESIYLHKKNAKSLLAFGPLWDFDTAYGGSPTDEYFTNHAQSNVFNSSDLGALYFNQLMDNTEVVNLMQEHWQVFKRQDLADVKAYMRNYVQLLETTGAYQRDYKRWHKQQNTIKSSPRKPLLDYEQAMLTWLDKRMKFMDNWLESLPTHK